MGIPKPPIPGLSELYGNLSEQFDAMTSYIQELTSILEVYCQQVKEPWSPPTDLPSFSIMRLDVHQGLF